LAKNVIMTDNSVMRTFFEKDIMRYPDLFVKIHDSHVDNDGEPMKIYTRIYQFVWNGVPCDWGIKFVYDFRNDKAKCSFDVVLEKVIKHLREGNMDNQKVQEHLDKFTGDNKFAHK
jgi:hypothetical protein